MERPNTVAGLLATRAEIQRALKDARRQVRAMVCDLDQIDATLKLFGPEGVKRVPVHSSVHRAHRGEMVRFCLMALWEAEGPLTSLDMTAA